MSFIIRAENIGKKYYITKARRYKMARDVITNAGQHLKRAISGFIHRDQPSDNRKQEELWALRKIDFEVQPGQSIGIIGKNGAGKSTLLKILSRITTPTEGRIRLRGRVGSLLEVGTGFHPELTGRENVYLNGAVLGMKKFEIDHSFDEIIAFSETEAFLDTPVKFFSSGMRMRLAFSVAAHLNPEILLIDEILAVGDLAFQQKSLGKMNEVASSGRTILFVSHSMAAIKALCQSAILLEAGQIVYQGGVEEAIAVYTREVGSNASGGYFQEPLPGRAAQIISAELIDKKGLENNKLAHDEAFTIQAQLLIQGPSLRANVCLNIYNANLELVIAHYDFESNEAFLFLRKPGLYRFEITIPANVLVPGQYSIGFEITQPKGRDNTRTLQHLDLICPFEIYDNGSSLARVNAHWRGLVHPLINWKLQTEPDKAIEQ